MFKAATVMSRERLSRELGQRLGSDLKKEIGNVPDACWLFSNPSEGIGELLLGIEDILPKIILVGCTSDGEISSRGFSTESVVLGGIATDRIEFHTASVEELGKDSENAGRRLGELLPPSVKYVQLFSDGLTGNGCALLKGLGAVVGKSVPIAGGTAGDSGKFEQTHQFYGTKVLTDAAVAIGFSGDFSIGTGVRSGWSPIGTAKKVTRAKGNVLYELNGQPALEVYERFLGKHADKLPEVGVEYPLGLVDESGESGDKRYHLLRATMKVNRDEGSISFAGEIPEGGMVRLTCGDYACIMEAAEEAARMALESLGDSVPAAVFLYSCMARKIVLGRRTRDEVEAVRKTCGTSLPLMGFYTYGEFCPVRCGGPSLFHNETATVSVIGF